MPPKKATKVPERIEEWEKAAAGQDKAIKINASIHEHYKLKSGSDMKEKDFLHLKAIWQAAEETDKWGAHTSLGLGTWFDNAQETLKNCPQFKAYLEAVERQDVPRPSVGMFWAAYEQQYQVSQSLERSPVRKAYEMNEELVNMSLVNFFQAVCACQPGLEINCNPARVHLTFDFRKVKDKKQAKEIDSRIHSLSCETDGLLESRATGRMYAILEAKAQQRAKHEPKVSWQETSEMVTAALSDRGSPKHLHPGRVVLFSQDAHELYVAEATLKPGYIEHMKDERESHVTKEEFVQVKQFGPYKTKKKSDIEYFAKLVLAFALRANEEEAGLR